MPTWNAGGTPISRVRIKTATFFWPLRALGLKICADVLDGPHQGQSASRVCWFTEMSKQKTIKLLEVLGISELTQLQQPFPTGQVMQAIVEFNKDGYLELRNLTADSGGHQSPASPRCTEVPDAPGSEWDSTSPAF